MKFIVFHGAYGSPDGNWFPQLKEQLGYFGQEVIVPKFPVDNWNDVSKAGPKYEPKSQTLKNWFKTFDDIMKTFKPNEKLCFIGHSLGPLFILHIVDKYNIQLDSAIFVSPFLRELGKWQFDTVNKTFYRTDFDFEKLRKLIPTSYVLYSENDPYVSKKHFLEFAEKMHSSVVTLKKAGHLNLEVNLNEFPLVYELCKSRLDLSLYQRYLAHRRGLYSVPYIKGKTEEIVYLDPKEVFDEGIFHFRNLQQEGFCTFYTAPTIWDPKSIYMQEARKAARRVKIERVFVVNKLSDLKRPALLEQINLDINAGIHVYFCMWNNIKKDVSEQDFGIWDNDYLCTVHFDKNNKINEVELTSRRKDIEKAQNWKKIILEKATRIHNASGDIDEFIKKYKK